MSLMPSLKNDIKAARQIWLPWWGVLCWMAVCAVAVWPLAEAGRLDLALPILNSIAVLGFVVVLKRRLARNVWFWIVMAAIAALHLLLILLVPWTVNWIPAIAIAVVDSGDFIVILAIISVVEHAVEARKRNVRFHES